MAPAMEPARPAPTMAMSVLRMSVYPRCGAMRLVIGGKNDRVRLGRQAAKDVLERAPKGQIFDLPGMAPEMEQSAVAAAEIDEAFDPLLERVRGQRRAEQRAARFACPPAQEVGE